MYLSVGRGETGSEGEEKMERERERGVVKKLKLLAVVGRDGNPDTNINTGSHFNDSSLCLPPPPLLH